MARFKKRRINKLMVDLTRYF